MSERRAGRGRKFIVILAAISAMGSMATHMVVPALPRLADDLAIPAATAQQVISFYLFGLAGGQLLAGPVVDGLGRRPALLSGLAIFTLAGLLVAASGSAPVLLLARVLQAMGAAAGLVTSRVMVADLYAREEAARRQANLMSVVLLSPAIAPVLGGLIAGRFGWRPIFLVLALSGTCALAYSALNVVESRPGHHSRDQAMGLLARYAKLFRNRRFLRVIVAIAGSSTTLYMFLAVAPFLLIGHWGLSEEEAGFCFLAVAAGGIAGTFAVGVVERRGNPLKVGLGCSLLASLCTLALALAYGEQAAWPMLIAPVVLVAVGAGITGPAGFAMAVHSEEAMAGTAVSLAGSLQMAASGGGAMALTLLEAPSFIVLSLAMTGSALVAFVASPPRSS